MTIHVKNALLCGNCFLIGVFMLTAMDSSLSAQMKNASSDNKEPSTQVPRAVSPIDPAQNAARKAWHVSMISRKLPKPGCFSASYPDIQWKEVPCVKPPYRNPISPVRRPPSPPAPPGEPESVSDVSAAVSGNTISSAEGSFPEVVNVTNVSTNGTDGLFELQLNTKPVSSSACKNAAVFANCKMWEQFLFLTSATHSYVYIEFFLEGFAAPCPGSGNTPELPGKAPSIPWTKNGNDCVFDYPSIQLDPQNIVNIGSLRLTASADPQGSDQVIMQLADGTIHGVGMPDSISDLAAVWTEAEFNVFGYENRRQAVFNDGAALVVKLQVENSGTSAPTVVHEGFTGETNNLVIGSSCSSSGNPPSIEFEEASENTQLSDACPPSPKTLPPPSCSVLQAAVVAAQEELAADRAKIGTAVCKGLSVECERQVMLAEQSLTTARALFKKNCSN
jgi:hypothetical protein